MAYNKRYNPDALPAHVEPEQAAAILSNNAPGRPSPQQQQLPFRPQQQQQPPPADRYNRPAPNPGQGSYHSNSGPPPQQQQYQQQYHPQRHDSRPPPSSDPRHNQTYPPPNQGGYQSGPPPPISTSRIDPRFQHPSDYPGSPPPSNYGFDQGRRPVGNHGRPPLAQQNRPPTVAPQLPRDGNDRDALWPLFQAVDKDRSGQLTESELRAALVNGDFSRFDPHTVRMMIRMFDTDRNGTISFDEFCGLWSFLAAWRNLFDRFDVDRSGNISLDEFREALIAFGYRLSPNFVALLFRTYDRRQEGAMSFDLFVQACISLKRMTDVFKKYDDDRDGYITLSFEEFLTEIIQQLD